MQIHYKKVIKIDELIPFVRQSAGATYSQLWHIFYYTRLCKYITYKHYIKIKPAFNKICTYKNLQGLCQLGYLKSPKHEVYCATDKVLPILKEAGFKIETLPAEPVGLGDINELHNTEIFIQAIKLKYFNTLLYPQFKETPNSKPYLIPDTLLIELDNESNRYKLTFLEVERNKTNWNNYIEEKRNKYIKLAQDINFYEYWAEKSALLGFSKSDIKDLKFSVCFVGNIIKDFGEGFSFTKTLDNARS